MMWRFGSAKLQRDAACGIPPALSAVRVRKPLHKTLVINGFFCYFIVSPAGMAGISNQYETGLPVNKKGEKHGQTANV
jgi:hypothetical protein